MNEATDTKAVSSSALNSIEARTVRVNVLLNRIKSAAQRGDLERVLNLTEEAGEANWTNRGALLEMGARDSIRGDGPFPPDDDDLLDTDALDLAAMPAPSFASDPE